MAYAGGEGENFFYSRLESARAELREKFSLAHKLLQEREQAMLLELQGIEDYIRKESKLLTGPREELLATKEQLYSSLKGNENRDILQTMLAPLDAKLRELEERVNILQKTELNWNKKGAIKDLIKELSCTFEHEEIEDSYREQVQRHTQQKTELSASKEQLYSSQKGNELQRHLQTLLGPLEARLRELEGGELFRKIELKWAREGLLEDFICTIKTYKFKADSVCETNPVLVACKYRSETDKPGYFKYPTFIAINPKTNNIYIGDESNHRIQVFDESCQYLISFSENMSTPSGICFLNDKVYVTQFATNALNVYTADGEFIKSNEKMELNHPCGVSGSKLHNALYICDRDNNRVQVLNIDLSLKCTIDGFIRPRDVKVTRKEIFVLDESNPCIHVYNYQHKLIGKLISFGSAERQVSNSLYFCVDSNSNILITDFSVCCVKIFTRNGSLIQRFGTKGENPGEFICPRGIALDSKCRIIVASRNPNHCIQFFPASAI